MANPNVEKLTEKFTNLTERFFDRWQQVIAGARGGDLSAGEVGGAAAEAIMDGIEALTLPLVLLVDADLTVKQVLRKFRFVVDGAKANKTQRTKLFLDPAIVLACKNLVDIADPANRIPKAHVEVKRSGTNRLVIKLKNLGAVPGPPPEGIYEGDIVDTAANDKPIATLVVEWPG